MKLNTQMQQLGAVRDTAAMVNYMPYIEHAAQEAEGAIVRRVMQDLGSNELTPEKALYAWMQIKAYRDLKSRMQSGIAKGQSAGENFGAMKPYNGGNYA